MITSQQTNHLYLSENLKFWYPGFYCDLEQILLKNHISFQLLQNTNDIWCRDYMPVQLSIDEFLWFQFLPDYYGKKLAHRITKQIGLHEQITGRHYFSDLVLDGGNLMYNKSVAVLTDKVFKDNPNKSKVDIIEQLKYELRIEAVILIPKQPYDWTSHADGMVRFADEQTLLVNDFSKESPSWRTKLYRALETSGLKLVTFPYVSLKEKNQYGEYTARGCYINFMQIGNVIVLPQFGHSPDKEAVDAIKVFYPSAIIETINCNDIANEGGVLNCISWCIKQ